MAKKDDPLDSSRQFGLEALELLKENLHDYAIIMLDTEGTVVSWSPAAERLKGYVAEEIIGQSASIFYTLDDQESGKFPNALTTAASEGRFEDESWRVRKDGTRFWASVVITALINPAGVLVGFGKVTRDITKRKQAEEERDRFFQLSLDMLCISNADGYFKRLSPAFTATLGWSIEELTSRPFLDFVHPDDRQATIAEVQRQMERGESVMEFENRYQHIDGTYRTLSWRSTPQPDGNMYATARDVTETRKVETMFRGLLESAPDAVVIVNEQSEIVLVNSQTKRLFGYDRAELIGKLVDVLIPARFRGNHVGHRTHYFDYPHPRLMGADLELFGLRKDGSEFPVEISLSPLETSDGLLVSSAIRDISNRKAAEHEISKLNEGLRVRAEELESARSEAERANAAKSDFLSHMSHELRTPLNAVIGFAQLLQIQSEDPKTLASAQSILKGGRHLLNLINEILDLARIEAGKLALSVESVQIGGVIDQAVDLVRPIAEDRNVAIHIEGEICRELHVKADRQRLLQVLLNLLTNAAKYNRPGGDLNVRCLDNGQGQHRVEIADSGIGIDESALPGLFKPFERGSHSEEGSGLGLALSKQLIELMQGDLILVETSKNGSTFAIDLKTADAPYSPIAPKAETTPKTLRVREAMRIVYIEDNLSNLLLMERVCAAVGGIELIPAMQASIGMQLIQDHLPDLVLLDLHLPDAQGIDVLKALRTNPATMFIPVIVLSADATDTQIKRVLAAGAKSYLTKPIDLTLLFAELNDVKPEKSS